MNKAIEGGKVRSFGGAWAFFWLALDLGGAGATWRRAWRRGSPGSPPSKRHQKKNAFRFSPAPSCTVNSTTPRCVPVVPSLASTGQSHADWVPSALFLALPLFLFLLSSFCQAKVEASEKLIPSPAEPALLPPPALDAADAVRATLPDLPAPRLPPPRAPSVVLHQLTCLGSIPQDGWGGGGGLGGA